MQIKNGQDLTLLCCEMFQSWIKLRSEISLSEIRIINKIFYYYDNNLECGHKELVADLNIPSSALSKLLKRWLNEGDISTKKSSTDKRRNFYFPSTELINIRESVHAKIESKINAN